jgi:hypothetical protein
MGASAAGQALRDSIIRIMRGWAGGIQTRFLSRPTVLKKTLFTSAAIAVWLFFLWRAISVFGPASLINDVSFNSDSAIPVLMSNEERPVTVFNLYYYAADRWGGWPFLIARLIRHVTGYRWTPESLFALQACWVFLGSAAFAALSRRDCLVAVLVYLIALCVHNGSRFLLFELSQTYAWQTTALLLSWYCLRRVFNLYLEPMARHATRSRLAWLLLSLGFSFLAVWSSVASTPFLLFLLSLEALRLGLKGPDGREHTFRFGIGKRVAVPYILGLTSIAAATMLERLLKMNYHRHSLKHYGNDFQAHFGLDTGHLAQNFSKQLSHITNLSWWPLYLIPTLAVALLACVAVYAFLSRNENLRAKLRTALDCDTVILAFGSYGIAAMNFVFAVAVDHVRRNLYDTRFLSLTNLFGPISGMLLVFLLIEMSLKTVRLRQYARPASVVLALALLAIGFPPVTHSPLYDLDKETALTLARKAPRQILMGTFWDTYVLVAMQPKNPMIPVPFEHQVLATPWTPPLSRYADVIVVGFSRGTANGRVTPPQTLHQYGRTLTLTFPRWYENEWYVFALYANERSESQ